MLQNTDIDILSPQLYTSGTESQNDWVGLTDAWLTSVPIVAPSIVQAYYYDQLGDNSVTVKLLNAKGYFVWSNTAPTPPGPGPTPDCVRCVLRVQNAGCRFKVITLVLPRTHTHLTKH